MPLGGNAVTNIVVIGRGAGVKLRKDNYAEGKGSIEGRIGED